MANTTSYVRVIGNEVDNPTDDTTYVFTPADGLKTFTLAGNSDNDTVAISALSTDFKIKIAKNLMTLVGLKTGASAGTIVKIQLDTVGASAVSHLAFLDGTVDVTFTPNAPGSLTGAWTVGGENIQKKFNFAKQAGNYEIDGAHTYADAAYAASGVLDAERFLLTTETDDVVIQHDNTYDLVRGVIDYRGEDGEFSTFTTFDNIEGNGHTAVELGVHHTSGAHDADLVCMSGVDRLMILEGDDTCGDSLTMDASTYGSDISNIVLDGNGSFNLTVNDLEVIGALDLDNADACSDLIVDGTVDGVNFYACIENCTGTSEAVIGVGVNGIHTETGTCSSIYLEVTQSATADCNGESASVGDLTIAGISSDVGISACECICISNYASAYCNGDATVGNVSLGDIDVTIADHGSYTLSQYNYAYVCMTGNATAGNTTVGDVGVTGATDAYAYIEFHNWACVYEYTGDAAVGDLTVGNVDMNVGQSGYIYLEVSNWAAAGSCGGDATAGDINVGDLSITAGDCFDIAGYIYNSATAECVGHNGTTGNVTVGDITFNLGSHGDQCLYVSNSASADCGSAIVGDLTVGNVTVNAGSSDAAYFNFGNCAYWGTTAAHAGNLTVGDVNVDMTGIFNSFSLCAVNLACADTDKDQTTGTLKVGNIDIYAGADAYVNVSLDQCAYDGAAGDVIVGDVTICIENVGSYSCATAYFDVEACGESAGDVTIGDIHMSGGSGAYVSASICISGTTGDIGDVSIGNVSIVAGPDAGCGYFYNEYYADHDLGNVTVGNILADASAHDSYFYGYACYTADCGSLGEINVGDITVLAGDDACAYYYSYYDADDQIGNVSFGDLTLHGIGHHACVSYYNEVYNCYDDIGNISYGDISIAAEGEDACVCGWISAENDSSSCIGDITIGNIDMTISGTCAKADLEFSYCSSEAIGTVTVGDINVTMNIDTTADDTSVYFQCGYMCMYVSSTSENAEIVIGDISVSAAEVTADFDAGADSCLDISISAYCGDLTIGNITVVGGYSNSGGLADNFDDLFGDLLDLDASKITVGDIDYSGYEHCATIDLSVCGGIGGAGIIWAAQDDTKITLNDGVNVVHLGAGTDTVTLDANDFVDPTLAANIDVIHGFTAGDDSLDVTGLSGDFAWGGSKSNYAGFLTAASGAMGIGTEVYAAKINGDTYVAFNTGGDTDLDFVVKLVGSTATLTATDVGI